MAQAQSETSSALVEDTVAFLLGHPPFDKLSSEALTPLARKTDVIFLSAPHTLFEEGHKPGEHCYVLIKGLVEFYRCPPKETTSHLIDVCDPGELFGIRAYLADDVYLSTAQVAEDSLLYRFPIQEFQKLAENHSAISWYLAADFAAGLPTQGVGMHQSHEGMPHFRQTSISKEKIPVQLALSTNADILQCAPETTVYEATKEMARVNVGSMIITSPQGHPMGILTDSDLRRKVLAKGLDPETLTAGEVMSAPVVTEHKDTSFEVLVVRMLEKGVGHLILTENGRADARPVAVVSEHDLLKAEGNHPAILLRQIHQSRDIPVLHELQNKVTHMVGDYLHQGWALPTLARMVTSLRDGIVHQCIRIAGNNMGLDRHFVENSTSSWLALGSEGRGEQMLPTDQDTAIILPDDISDEDLQRIEAWTHEVSSVMEQVGYELCPAGVMSSQPKWRRTLSGWKQVIDDWINTPDQQAMLEAAIFFDFRSVHGDASLADDLRAWIIQRLQKDPALLRNMAKSACDTPPPLSFFGNFVVEKSGGRESGFDIKKRAQLPLSDAARILAFEAGMPHAGGTFARFNWLAEQRPRKQALYKDAASAYALFLKVRAKAGVANGDGGRYLSPKTLERLERQQLRNAFSVIDDIHRHLKLHYQLSYLA